MTDDRHFENSFIAISQPKTIRFQRNLVGRCRLCFQGRLLNHKGRFLLTPMLSYIVFIWPIDWIMSFKSKGKNLTPWVEHTKTPTPKHVLGALSKNHASRGKVWMRWRNQQNDKKIKRAPYAQPIHPICGSRHSLREESICEHNQTCHISSESVDGFRNPRWPKMTIPIDLDIALTTVYALIIIIIIIIRAFVRRTMSASELNLRRWQSLGGEDG